MGTKFDASLQLVTSSRGIGDIKNKYRHQKSTVSSLNIWSRSVSLSQQWWMKKIDSVFSKASRADWTAYQSISGGKCWVKRWRLQIWENIKEKMPPCPQLWEQGEPSAFCVCLCVLLFLFLQGPNVLTATERWEKSSTIRRRCQSSLPVFQRLF